ncbi:MAG: Lpg1974 family pore-forming outer membrane protein [Planctomycetaceae bacterium]
MEVQNQFPQQAYTQQYQLPVQQAQIQQSQNMMPVQYQAPVQPQFYTQQLPEMNQPAALGTNPWNGTAPSAPVMNNQTYATQSFPVQNFSAQPQQIQPVQQVQPYIPPVAQQQIYVEQPVVSQNYSPINAAPQPVQPVQQYQTPYGQAAFNQLQTASYYTPVSCDNCAPPAAPSCQSGTCNSMPYDSGYSADAYCGATTDVCSTDYCGTGGCCGTTDCCKSSYYAGVEFLWLQPNFQENVCIVLDPPPSDNIVMPCDYDYEFSPRAWFGWESCDGYGFRFSYWEFDHDLAYGELYVDVNQLAFIEVTEANGQLHRNAFAGPGETLVATHEMSLQTADFEFTSRHKFCKHDILVGAGLRYAQMDQHMTGTAYSAGWVVDELVDHKHGFEGFGPTVSLFWNRPFDSCGGLSVYSRARASILFGDAYQNVYEVKNAGANVGYDTYSGDESLAIGELGLGLQYTMMMGCDWELFCRGGYEAQLWWDAGGPLNTQGDMALHGLTLALGFNH